MPLTPAALPPVLAGPILRRIEVDLVSVWIATPLGYDPDALPSFRMCPQEREKLVIVHGSCRQLFTVPPVQDDPIDDDKPFVPPGGWPGESPTVESPTYDPAHPDEFPDHTF